MWGYQPHFRISAQSLAERIFNQVDKRLEPKVFLVGVLVAEMKDRYPICIEPEDCGYDVSAFESVLNTEKSQSEKNEIVIHSHPEVEKRYEKRNAYANIRKKIVNSIETDPRSSEVISFCSFPVRVEGHVVVVVLQVQKAIFESHYHLKNSIVDRLRISTSFLECLVDEYLKSCEEGLEKDDPGEKLSDTLGKNKDETILAAGKDFMYTPAFPGRNFEGLHGLFQVVNTISSIKYEGEDCEGKILFCRKNHEDIKVEILFKSPVSLNNSKGARKLLEMSSGENALLSDSANIYGLGKVLDSYKESKEDIFVVRFKKHFVWEVEHFGHAMMLVDYGEPRLPKQTFDIEKYVNIIKRVFIDITEDNIKVLTNVINAAIHQKHGTTIVISRDAINEAVRLGNQSTNIEPKLVNDDLVRQVTSIDGAVLINEKAVCFAIGVILDGMASKNGTSSRGARYNSAIRYVESVNCACVIVVVSVDGGVDIIPDLRPQIRHSEIADAIIKLREIGKQKDINSKEFNLLMGYFQAKRFYIRPQECAEINELSKNIDKRITSNIKILHEELYPFKEMNDEYYLAE